MIGEGIENIIKNIVTETLNKSKNVELPNDIIETDNIGEVIEKLAILHCRMWYLEDTMGSVTSDAEMGELKRKIDICFKVKRPKYVEAINRMIDNAIVNNKSLIEDSVKLYKGYEDKENSKIEITYNKEEDKIFLVSDKTYDKIQLNIKYKNILIYLTEMELYKNINYWFTPQFKIYKNNHFTVEIIYKDRKIYEKKFNEENKILKLKPNLGTGDLFLCLSFIKNHYDEYDKFVLYLNYNILSEYRNNSEQIKIFTKDLVGKLFSNLPKISFVEFDENYDDYLDNNIIHLLNVGDELVLENMDYLVQNLEHDTFKCDVPFFVLNTKIRLEKNDFYLEHKDEFFEILNKLSNKYKLVLMGEKENISNKEYDNELPNYKTIVMYDDIMKNVNNENIIDLTKKDLIHNTNITDFLNDCYLMNKSDFSIFWGVSGPSIVNLSFSKKVIGFRTWQGEIDDYSIENNYLMSKHIENDSLFLTNNINDFFKKLNELI